MAEKKRRASQSRDQRSVDAARDGTAVTLRLVLLRRLDRRPNQRAPRLKRLFGYFFFMTAGFVATNHETVSTSLHAMLGH